MKRVWLIPKDKKSPLAWICLKEFDEKTYKVFVEERGASK